MRRLLPISLLLVAQSVFAQAPPSTEGVSETPTASDAEIFTAAGFRLSGEDWGKCEDPGTASYQPGEIIQRGDFNGDGQPDALVAEGGIYCFGMTGTGYTLVTRKPDGSWAILDERIGIPNFLETRGVDNWPDIEVGGPGFCFPVLRWNGSEYLLDRMQYEGEPCAG